MTIKHASLPMSEQANKQPMLKAVAIMNSLGGSRSSCLSFNLDLFLVVFPQIIEYRLVPNSLLLHLNYTTDLVRPFSG